MCRRDRRGSGNGRRIVSDEFYVGYARRAPDGIARHSRRWVPALAVGFVAAMAWVGWAQPRTDPGTFEYGVEREFEGVIRESPLPRLRITGADGRSTNLVLVGMGKHGIPAFARGHDGERVALRGTLVERGDVRMLELAGAGQFRVVGPRGVGSVVERTEDLGVVALTGELVDTKCWLGVMRPAEGKVHRACAVRCLSGGVPPGLLLRDADGNGVVAFLVGAGGGTLAFDPQWGGRVVEAEGRLGLEDGTAVLRTSALRLASRPGRARK